MAERRLSKARAKSRAASLVRFYVGETCYAFEVSAVEEVTNPGTLTELAEMGESVAGVTDHRGRVIPVVDLRPRFGLPGRTTGPGRKWILMRSSFGLVGFVVDRVRDVVASPDSVESAPQVGGKEKVRGVRGVLSYEDQLVFVLDEDRLASVVESLDVSAREG